LVCRRDRRYLGEAKTDRGDQGRHRQDKLFDKKVTVSHDQVSLHERLSELRLQAKGFQVTDFQDKSAVGIEISTTKIRIFGNPGEGFLSGIEFNSILLKKNAIM